VIGHVGLAGPGDAMHAQVHIELFSKNDLFDGWKGVPWEALDGTAGGRFCDLPRVNDPIDSNHDAMLSKDELKQFFNSGGGQAFYFLAVRFVSEWIADPDWSESLRGPKDFRKLTTQQIDQMVADQITPGLWWTDVVASHAKLPVDGVVFHYHPIAFVSWLNEKLIDAQNSAVSIDVSKAAAVPEGITDDRHGGDMASKSLFVQQDTCNENITLKDLAAGYDANVPGCKL
jgi:hypothetical protein